VLPPRLRFGVALLTAARDVVHTPETRWRVQVIDVCEVNPAAQRCQEWKPFPEVGRRARRPAHDRGGLVQVR
jgi:hypothetical protein